MDVSIVNIQSSISSSNIDIDNTEFTKQYYQQSGSSSTLNLLYSKNTMGSIVNIIINDL